MIDWTNGKGTARYWALRLLREACGPGDVFVPTSVSGNALVFAQGLVGADGGCRIVMVNRGYDQVNVSVGSSCRVAIVDERSGEGPPRETNCHDGVATLGAYASAVARLPACPA